MTLYTDIDPFCCAVLASRAADGSLPDGDVVMADIRDLNAQNIAGYHHIHTFCGIGGIPLGLAWSEWPESVSIITGGFPCQDISAAGKGAGLDGSRSGLFWEMMRVVECKRPDVVLAENVGALSARGLRRVVAALGSLGYYVGAFRVGAWVCGSPQERERWWIVAHAKRFGLVARPGIAGDQAGAGRGSDRGNAPGRPSPRRQLADVRGDGQGAVGLVGERPIPDLAGPRVGMGDSEHTRLQGHGIDAGQPQIAQPWHAGQPGRWPRVLWVDENGDPVPTPQYEWEPPRLFPGTRTINAAWRLALMGFPTDWLDLPDETLARLAPSVRTPEARARWANKQGVKATGNAQVPQCVELVMASFLDAICVTGVVR